MRRKRTKEAILKDRLWEVIKRFIKLRDKGVCQRCRKQVEGTNAHTSHVIPKSAGNILRYDEYNLKLLCFHCHINFWHKNPIEAYEWFKSTFPERYEYLMEKKNRYRKNFTKEELEEMIEIYTDKCVGMEITNESSK